jgi:hypothetical protein
MSAAVVGSMWRSLTGAWSGENREAKQKRRDNVMASEELMRLLIEAGRAIPSLDPARRARVHQRILAHIARETRQG